MLSETEKVLGEFEEACKTLSSFSEFQPFKRWLEEQINCGIEKMLKGRKEDTMRELAREVKVYKTVLSLFRR